MTGIIEDYIVGLKHTEEERAELPHLYHYKWYDWAWRFFTSTNPYNFLCSGNQVSKAEPLDNEIPTPDGLRKMRDLKIGDEVFDINGQPTKIVDIPFVGRDECYRVTFHDGTSVICSKNHEWVCKGPRQRFRKDYEDGRGGKFSNEQYDQWVVREIDEIINHSYRAQECRPKQRYSIPMARPVCGDEEVFDPYMLGLILGDGCAQGSIVISNPDQEIRDYILKNYDAVPATGLKATIDIRIRGLTEEIRCLDLFKKHSHEKFIPKQYFRASIDDRKALLAGLLDTDGTSNWKSSIYTTVSERLAYDVFSLVCSLGGTCSIKKRKSGYTKDGVYHPCRDHYSLNIKTDFNPFRLSRKAAKWTKKERCRRERVIWKIEPVGMMDCKCITVASPTQTYLTTRNYIVTHNSSSQIRKCIMLATEPDLWPKIWTRHKPTQFWYCYPSGGLATAEFDEKWMKEFLPRGSMKDHPQYGWKEERQQYKRIHCLRFNSGITVYFHSYEQKDSNLQASSVFAMFCDEELPEEMFDEMNARLSAVDGLFHMAFTATLGLRMWYETMEVKGPGERFKGALKIQVSKWDCQNYMDGTPSFWTTEKIKREESACRNEGERLKRIEGRFVLGSDRLFPSFKTRGHVLKSSVIKGDGLYFGSVYVSEETGKAGIVIIKTKEDLSYGEVVFGHYFDNQHISSLEIYTRFAALADGLDFVDCFCNVQGRDFITISRTRDPHFNAVRKPTDNGDKLINSLFATNLLMLTKSKTFTKELVYQLTMARKDDEALEGKEMLAALVVGVTNIQWNFRGILGLIKGKNKKKEPEGRMRYWMGLDRPEPGHDKTDREFEDLNAECEVFEN